MKSIHILFFLTSFFYSNSGFTQENITKEEILEFERTRQENSNLDSVFRWEVHSKTRTNLDKLIMSGIDTLLVYSIYFPGLGHLKTKDTCLTDDPVYSYFFFKTKGQYFFETLNGPCELVRSTSIHKPLNFAIANYSKIEKEFFMGVIHLEKISGKILWTTIDHEPKYTILIVIGNNHKLLRFTEDELKNKEGMFFSYNNDLVSKKLFDIITAEVNEKR